MLELLLCSALTILPDYLFRRFVQGKRFGREITLYSVWFELRWGITLCILLTVLLITVIFYNHPSTTNITLFFRTVPILPETNGRVAELYVGFTGEISQGAPVFRLDSSKQEAAVETARRKIAEIDAEMAVARTDTVKAGSLIHEASTKSLEAGFGQIEAQIMKAGMTAEVTCVSKPWTVIPMVVTSVQDYIAAGQFRGGEQLIDPKQVREPGTLLAFLEPL